MGVGAGPPGRRIPKSTSTRSSRPQLKRRFRGAPVEPSSMSKGKAVVGLLNGSPGESSGACRRWGPHLRASESLLVEAQHRRWDGLRKS